MLQMSYGETPQRTRRNDVSNHPWCSAMDPRTKCPLRLSVTLSVTQPDSRLVVLEMWILDPKH